MRLITSNSARLMATVLFLAAFAPVGLSPRSEGAASQDAPKSVTQRADPETIRRTTEEILADPRFAPRMTVWEWLSEKLRGWRAPRLGLSEWWANALGIAFLIWGSLTILAILAHWAWSFWVLLRSRSGRAGSLTSGGTHFKRVQSLSYEEWLAETRRLADARDFRGAICAVMGALLRRLHDLGVLRTHSAKTNGDYVREYAPDRGGRDLFRTFAADFDRLIYGGASCEQVALLNMKILHERIANDARKESRD